MNLSSLYVDSTASRVHAHQNAAHSKCHRERVCARSKRQQKTKRKREREFIKTFLLCHSQNRFHGKCLWKRGGEWRRLVRVCDRATGISKRKKKSNNVNSLQTYSRAQWITLLLNGFAVRIIHFSCSFIYGAVND